MRPCVFCEVVRGEREAAVVYEDAETVAFLDHKPLLHGHCLLVPRRHVETLAELPAELAGPLFANVQRLAGAVERGLDAAGAFVAINVKISQSVPHLHVHVVPRWKGDKWNGTSWVQVASATSVSSNEDINYNNTSGAWLLWGAYSYSGSGTYHFYLDRP